MERQGGPVFRVNVDVVSWLRTFQSTHGIVRHLLRCLSFWAGECGFIFLPVYIRSGNNRLQDWMTRAKTEEVLAYMEKRGYSRIWLLEDFKVFASRGFVHRALMTDVSGHPSGR